MTDPTEFYVSAPNPLEKGDIIESVTTRTRRRRMWIWVMRTVFRRKHYGAFRVVASDGDVVIVRPA